MQYDVVFGIDVDKARLTIARFGVAGTEVIENRKPMIAAWLKKIPAGSRIGVESTSRYHEAVVVLAQAAGHTVFVLNPRDVRHYARGIGRRGKTDRVDAEVIARYVAKEGDALHAHVPRTPEQESMHVLQQQRAALRRSMTQLQQALTGADFTALMRVAKATLQTLDRKIQALAKQPSLQPLYRALMSVPGIGPVVAACLTHHLQRWPLARLDAWIACTGLDPRPNESGQKIGQRALSKRGPATLRQMLYLAAMTFARHPLGQPLEQRYRQRGLSSTATYNILARLLARLTWAIKVTDQPFDPVRFAKDHKIA